MGPAELQHLFHQLGIPSAEIEKAEIKAGTLDVDLKARKVLETWRQRNDEEATREKILCALEECGYRYAKKILEKKWMLKGKNPKTQVLKNTKKGFVFVCFLFVFFCKEGIHVQCHQIFNDSSSQSLLVKFRDLHKHHMSVTPNDIQLKSVCSKSQSAIILCG